jgi:hypothetical protein
MANAPRDLDEILSSYYTTWNDIDPTIDISKGPVASLVFATAQELSRLEAQAAYLSSVYQLENVEDMDEDDLSALGNNYSLDPDIGSLATATVTFYRESRPIYGETYIIYEGTLVGSEDGRYTFVTVKDTLMSGSNADIYYNPDARRYEITCAVEAVSVGDDFNIPEDGINSILTDVSDFDGVTNRYPARGGLDPLDKLQFRNIIWNNIQALDSDFAGRIISVLLDQDPAGVTDVRLVSSAEFTVFERLSLVGGRTAYDMYVITDAIDTALQTTTALGGETTITLDNPPVQSVQYVFVDGQAVTFTFVRDTNPTVRNSPLANDHVELVTPLQPGQTVEITYYNYQNLWNTNDLLQRRAKPFGNDVLVRLAYAIPVFIAARMTTNSAEDREAVKAAVQDYTEYYLRNPGAPSSTRQVFVSSLDPADYQQAVLRDVTGVSTFTVTMFARLDNAVQDVAILGFDDKTEYPILAPGFIVD